MTRSSHPFSMAGKLRKWTGATNAKASARATFCCCSYILRLIALAQQVDDASRIPLANDPFQRKTSQGPTSLLEEGLAQVHGVEHVIGDRLGQPARTVSRAENGIEPNRVQIKDLVRMPGLAESFVELLKYCVAERLRIRMCVDRQHVH